MLTNKKKKRRYTAFDWFILCLFITMSLLTLYPFYNVIIVSLSNTVAVATHTPYIIPHVFDLTGYKTIIFDINFINAVRISMFVTVVGSCVNMFLSVTGAYVLSKKNLPGRRFMLNFILFTMLFGGGLVPTYLTVKGLKLVNSVWAMILPTAISTYYLIIMKNYFMDLPVGLTEAAKIDGAGEWTILWKIVFPISKPFMATFLLFYSVERWNEWYNALLYINDTSRFPLQIYMRDVLISLNSQLTTQAQMMLTSTQKVSSASVQMAAIIITAVPIICVYPVLQKYFENGIKVGGLKEKK